jgi:hypothetical protein
LNTLVVVFMICIVLETIDVATKVWSKKINALSYHRLQRKARSQHHLQYEYTTRVTQFVIDYDVIDGNRHRH